MENNNNNNNKKLFHLWMEPIEDFFKRIDENGGWPLGYKYVSLLHSLATERPCEFGNTYFRNEWWTTICDCNQYYWWKIDKAKKGQIIYEVIYKLKKSIEFGYDMDNLIGTVTDKLKV